MRMRIRFWGVRGSIASPGLDTVEVGGNTSCVEVIAEGTRVILDAGTGLRALGNMMMRESAPRRAALLLSHLHWDHIQGLPFFAPLYAPTTELTVYGQETSTATLQGALSQQMTSPVFPVELRDVPAAISMCPLRDGSRVQVGPMEIRARKLNHPGGVLGYRIQCGGHVVVYATDTEHYDCVDPVLRDLASDADVLIYDAQYTPEEYRGEVGPARVGWGHSTFEAGARLAEAAGVRRLVLFHHDPTRDDRAVASLEQRAHARFAGTLAARESLVLELSDIARAA